MTSKCIECGHRKAIIIKVNNGVVGGAYLFDGVDDYISLPYCFDGSTISEITVETWIKTSEPTGSILSFERDNYFELGITDGHVVITDVL